MRKNTQQATFKLGGLLFKNLGLMVTGLFLGLTLSACSSSGPSSKSSQNNPQNSRSAEFQRRVDAEQAAEDQRDRNNQIQEQNRRDELELRKMRAERAAQRNAAREQRRAEYEQSQQVDQNQ